MVQEVEDDCIGYRKSKMVIQGTGSKRWSHMVQEVEDGCTGYRK